ncbi:MarR family winged helix-turn-helix transcriptional regulator [Nocardioides panacisoli]|uniref:MarR family winged helix-turn-helix transcriptional regulator n=1 Tax=Nocardioides panacisoli TaxID=627624 RepID=A0ABP7IJ66_9ACTN
MQPPSDLGILVLLAYQGFVRLLHEDMAQHGYDDLGRSDGVVMRVLNGGGRKVSDLARLLDITPQGTAQIVEDMERRGYVVRRPDPADARARLVELGERGRGAIDAARAFHRRFEARMARRHGVDAIAGFRTVLDDMAGAAGGGLDRELRALYL